MIESSSGTNLRISQRTKRHRSTDHTDTASPIRQPYLAQSYRTHFKLLMRYSIPNLGTILCLQRDVGIELHLLSAGHCIYNHDPLGDGTGRGAGYAAEIWAWPSQTDDIDPVGIPDNWEDFPWGVAKATQLVHLLRLDQTTAILIGIWPTLRSTGGLAIASAGWRAKWVFSSRRLYYSGYPVEEPYVPHDTPFQYPGGNLGNVIGYTPSRIKLSAYTYGGHSGGAVYRCCIGPDYVFQGVNSTSNRQGYAEATCYTLQMISDLPAIIIGDDPRNVHRSSRPVD